MGMSQDLLAHFSGVSRVTINELEGGSLPELGLTKLVAILSVLGVALHTERKTFKSGLAAACTTASISYQSTMTPNTLKTALASGQLPAPFIAHISTLLDEAPMQIIVAAVKEAAEKSGVAPKQIWKHLKGWASDLKSPRVAWR